MSKKITLTYAPSTNEKNRICGHTFEVMDYFLLLYDLGYRNINILIIEDISPELLFNAWEDKYILPSDYKSFITFSKKKIIISGILIFTSGFYKGFLDKYTLVYKKLIIFSCNPYFNYSKISLKNFIVLEDKRIYKNNFIHSRHYIKKIYFKRYKKLRISENKTLIYINNNLRKIEVKYNPNTLIVSGNSGNFPEFVVNAPVENLFEKFDKFLYTKTTRRFDCSPRLITECKFYKKEVIWDFDFDEYCGKDYGDTGLYWRNYDIQNNFRSLELKEDDYICEIMK